jgi:uncharacterized coiled-coil protein SlyX
MTTPKETCPKCSELLLRISFHEQTIRELNKVPLPEVVNLRELTSKLRCRITELEKENERLRKVEGK